MGMSNFMNLVVIETKDLIFKWLLVIFWIGVVIYEINMLQFCWFMHVLKVWCFCSAGDFLYVLTCIIGFFFLQGSLESLDSGCKIIVEWSLAAAVRFSL